MYWQLILSEVGTVAGGREVDIGRKTGYRWRAENGGAAAGSAGGGGAVGPLLVAMPDHY
jgi:hypothetical protein